MGKHRETPNILLSIHPEHALSILGGLKRWEYRKVAPAVKPPIRFVLYATHPVQAAVGVVWSYTVIERSVSGLLDLTLEDTPHDRTDVLEYFDGDAFGYGIHVNTYRRFEEPVSRESLVDMDYTPHQNFRYIGTVHGNEPEIEPDGVNEPWDALGGS